MGNKKRIVIFVVFLFCLFFMTTFAGAPAQNTIIATRNVTFIDGYDNSNISEQTIEVGKDANIPSDPSHDGLVFAGWYLYDDQDVRVEDFTNILNDLRVVAKYAGDINRNGVADDNEERYTVQFVDTFNNRVLSTQEVLPGMSATAPNVPNHPGVTFAGWATGYENVTGNTTINTVYTQVNEEPTPVFYQVTFMDGFDNSVIATVAVGEGLTATAPQAPTHAGKVFDGWQGSYSNVTGDGTVTATYADDLNNDGIADYLQEHYTVTFVAGEHGSIEGTTIYTNIVKGLTFEQVGIKVPKTIPANELYKFANWTPEMKRTVNENAVYTANFTPVGEDKNNNGVADEEETHTLTVQHITINKNTNAENILGSDSKSLLEGDSFTATAEEFKGYTLASEEVISGVMGKEDITVKFVYVPTMEDKNGNGIADEHYLTVKYMSGSNELGTEDAVIYSEGETYEVTAKEFEGYTLTSDETITGTMGNKDITVTFNYKTTIEDKNNNGVADEHYLTVKYMSGSNELGTEKPVIYSEGETYTVTAKKFAGYTLTGDNKITGTMGTEDITVTFNYKTTIEDKNNNGVADEHYLTVKYMSGSNELGTEEPEVYSEGETYEVTAKEFEGYTLTGDNKITGTMGTEDITVTFNYKTTIEDKNNNGIADEHYLIIKSVSGKNELSKDTRILSKGDTYSIKAEKFTGYKLVSEEVVSGTMQDEDITVTFNYETEIPDKNKDGIANEHYLTVKYMSGTNELGTEDAVIYSEGETYEVTAKEFAGYTLTSDETITGTMGTEDITVTFNYKTTIEDKNNNGVADEHYLTVKYMSGINELGTEDAVVYSEGETYTVKAKEFEGYTLTSDETITGTMGTEDITVTFNYKTTIEDKNGNDIADEHYLTVKHVSGKTELETEEAVIYSEGETYTVNAKEFDGYAVDGDQEITGTMGNKDVTVTFNYKDIKPVITDIKNDHGKNKIWTNAANVKDKTVKVTVEGKAAKGRTIVGYSINGIEGLFQESPEFTFTENQTINVAVIDNKGIVSEVETYEITNFDVDNNKPVFNPKTEENPVFNGEGGVAKKVNFNVVDKESGLRYVTSLSGKYATADAFEKAVKDEKHTVDEMPQITVAEDGTATITALKNGFYTIYAEDWAGNKEVLVFEVTGIEEVKDTDDKVINETHYGVNYKIGKTQYEDKAWFLIYWKRYQPYRTVELKAENGTEILAAYWSKEASNTPDEFFSKSYEKAYEMPVDATTGTNNVNFTMKGSKYTTIYTIYVKSRNKTTGEIEEYVMPVKASAYFIFWEMNN